MTQSAPLSRFTHEELLRHLLVADQKPDENTIYSFLLGYRLYQSPNKLLSEIHRRSTNSSQGPKRFYRQNVKQTSKRQQQCSKCYTNHDQKTMSKSTNNMLDDKANDKRPEGLYADLAEHKALMNASIRGRKSRQQNQKAERDISRSSDDEDSIAANKTEDFVDLEVFTDENRRFTAPAFALDNVNIKGENFPATKVVKGTDFGTSASESFVTKKYIHVVATETGSGQEYVCADGVVASGEDTIRRRRKGRRRQTVKTSETNDNEVFQDVPDGKLRTNVRAIVDCQSVASRDSGILSACADDEDEYSNVTSSSIANRTSANIMLTSPSSSMTTFHDKPSPSINITNDSGILPDETITVCSHYENLHEDEGMLTEKKHLLSILDAWVREFPSDFRNKKIKSALQNVTSNIKNEHDELKDSCVHIEDTLSRHLATQENFEQRLRDSERKDAIMQSDDFKKTKEWMIDILSSLNKADDANRIAKQLCIIEMDLLRHVGSEEFLQMFTSNGDEDTKTNLGACVRWFNHLSHLVATSVCLCRKVKHRRHVIALFSRAASICYEMSNFNSAMAVLTGLNLGAVARLNKTWDKMEVSDLNKLQNIFDPSNNFRKYRSVFNERNRTFEQLKEIELQKKLNRTSMNSTSRTNRLSTLSQHSVSSHLSTSSQSSQHRDSGIECETDNSPNSGTKKSDEFTFDHSGEVDVKDGVLIPFLTLLVKDVYFLNHSTPTVEASGSINFEKLRHLGELLKPLAEWKQNPCDLKIDEELSHFLQHSPVMKDAELYLLSYKREPPRNKFEKNQLKSLRSEFETKKRTRSIARRMSRRKTM